MEAEDLNSGSCVIGTSPFIALRRTSASSQEIMNSHPSDCFY